MPYPLEGRTEDPYEVKLEFPEQHELGFETGDVAVVDISSSDSGGKSLFNAEVGEEVMSTASGLARGKSVNSFLCLYNSPESCHAMPSGKKPRLEPMNPHGPTGHRFNHALVDVEVEIPQSLTSNQQQEQEDFQLPDDFLEPLQPATGHSVDTAAFICMLPSFPPARAGTGKSAHQVSRQFWKAGDYANICLEHKFLQGGMDHVRVHPKFLHSNATSHKWALGAVAELLDNALDEVVNGATFVRVDMVKNPRNGDPMLQIEDDGGGMNPDCMRHCMSLGYSVKSKIANTIGQYGNGFKTSTMRLGADVIVFSRCSAQGCCNPTETIGLLSYTFLRDTGQEDIFVPMIDYEIQHFGLRKLIRGNVDDWNKNMETIKHWSPYSTEAELLDQFKGMPHKGTRVVVYNLWEDDQGQLELDFDTNRDDIQVRGANRDEKKIQMAEHFPNSRHYLTYRHSLRSYASILYLRLPLGFRIILRGKEVEHHSLINDLMFTEELTYKPQYRSEQAQKEAGQMKAVVTIGFVKDAKEHIDVQGFSVYHKNRLIKPFWRIWNSSDTRGRGIIGVLEANFVEPAHDKQGFERTIVLTRLETRLIEMQKNYWSKNCHKVGYINKSLKRDGKLTSKKDGFSTGELGSEKRHHAVLQPQDSRRELEVQGSHVPSAVSGSLMSQLQEAFPSHLSQARSELEIQGSSVSLSITRPMQTNELQSDSQYVRQTSVSEIPPATLDVARSVQVQTQDIPAQRCRPEVAPLMKSPRVEKNVFSLRTKAAINAGSLETNEATWLERNTSTSKKCTMAETNLDLMRTSAENDAVAQETDVDSFRAATRPEVNASSLTTRTTEETNVVALRPSRATAGTDTGACESAAFLRTTMRERHATTLKANNRPGADAASLRVRPETSAASPAPDTLVPEFNAALLGTAFTGTSAIPEIDEAPAGRPSSLEEAVDASPSIPKATKRSPAKSSKANGPLDNESLMKGKSLENLGRMFAKKAAASGMTINLEDQAGKTNSCSNLSRVAEAPEAAPPEDFTCLSYSCSHLRNKQLKSQLVHAEQRVQLLKRNIEEAIKEKDNLREQLREEYQLGEISKRDLQNKLDEALSRLEELKADNTRKHSVHH